MGSTQLRPRFETSIDCAPRGVLRALATSMKQDEGDALITGAVFQSSAVLRISAGHRHFWSPELQIGVDSDPENESVSVVRGMFGPRPSVWSMFIALYVFVVFAGVMGAMFGLSQLVLGRAALALWSVPAAALGIAVVYGIARTGRLLGRQQMNELKSFLDNVLERCAQTDEP